MKFNKYEKVIDYWNDNSKLIEKDEWYNCLIIQNCMETIEKNIDEIFLATITNDENETELLLSYRKPYKLLLYSPTNNYSDEILKFAAEEIYKYDKELLGVNTREDVAKKFTKYYCELANLDNNIHTELRILLLEKLDEPKLLEDVTYRKAKEEDKEILKEYIKLFYKDGMNKDITEEIVEEKYNKYNKLGYYVLEKDNKIVSQAVYGRKMKNGKGISSVYTPKEERGKKYAYNLVYRMSKDLLDQGYKYGVLYTDDSNPISNHVYEKIGYKRQNDWKDIDYSIKEKQIVKEK